MHPHAQFGVAGIDENASEDEAADPNDRASEIEWAGLHHS
jgi:hypothetical protein